MRRTVSTTAASPPWGGRRSALRAPGCRCDLAFLLADFPILSNACTVLGGSDLGVVTCGRCEVDVTPINTSSTARRRLDDVLASKGLAGQITTATKPSSLEPVLPVDERLAGLLPVGGLRRGGIVQVASSNAILLTLIARYSSEGGWSAVLGMPELGLLAAAEAGVNLERLLLVTVAPDTWDIATATMIDGVELVVVAPPVARVPPRIASKILGKARDSDAAIITVGKASWPRVDATLSPGKSVWHGIGQGHGRLRWRELEVRATGTGALTRARSTTIRLGDVPASEATPAANVVRGLRAVG